MLENILDDTLIIMCRYSMSINKEEENELFITIYTGSRYFLSGGTN